MAREKDIHDYNDTRLVRDTYHYVHGPDRAVLHFTVRHMITKEEIPIMLIWYPKEDKWKMAVKSKVYDYDSIPMKYKYQFLKNRSKLQGEYLVNARKNKREDI